MDLAESTSPGDPVVSAHPGAMFTMHCWLRWMSALGQCEKNKRALGWVDEVACMGLTLIRDPQCKISACAVLACLMLISRRMKAAIESRP